ncbi:hypothetical protein E3O25_05455 [Cryobacterium sp. TMT1-3]|uniref:hypothetical protein n=1 Tax=Cryobacterium sp. TMT1-3 TaxID=1259237 RepID=UPI0010692CD7|nr:hypothetical protein [Cryobacterium sp. TMT1-3]TFC29358.1 hypothetical protein E3O25_05455 [Cryobacterium sp. TMT1-3]
MSRFLPTNSPPLRQKILLYGMPFLAIVVAGVFIVNVVVNAIGLRGSDQYWYVGYMPMLEATGLPVTNAIYPSAALLFSPDVLPPRMHNIPVTYLVGWVHGAGFTDYQAWVLVDAVFAFVIAAGLYLIAKKMGLKFPILSSIFFLSFPFTLWFTLNALAEMSLALGSILLLFGTILVTRLRRTPRQVALISLFCVASGTVLMIYTRDNYFLLIPAQIYFAIWACRKLGVRWFWALPSLGFTGVLVGVKSLILPSYPHAGPISQLMAGTRSEPGQMTSYYNLDQSDFSLGEFVEKAMAGLLAGVLPSSVSEVITESFILAIAIISIFVWRGRDGSKMIIFWSSVVLAIYLATSAAFQAQNRYIFALVPFVAVLSVDLLGRVWSWSERNKKAVRLGFRTFAFATLLSIVVLNVASTLTAHSYSLNARVSMAENNALSSQMRLEPSGSILTLSEGAEAIPFTYSAVPRPVLAVNPRITSERAVADMIVKWEVRVLVGDDEKDFAYLSRAVKLAYGNGAILIAQPKIEGVNKFAHFWTVDTVINH